MGKLLKVTAVAVLLFTAAVAYHGYNKLSEDMVAMREATDAAGSIVMAHRAFASDVADLRLAIAELTRTVEKISQGMEKVSAEHDHLHDNITKVMIKLNRHLKLHPSHKRAG